jgi:tRNA G18 (ribose-2'-O)-methylase SpoU
MFLKTKFEIPNCILLASCCPKIENHKSILHVFIDIPDVVNQVATYGFCFLALIAVLENIRSAYNVGSVFRTADAFLMEAIYITGYTCTPPHKEIKKTALGAEDSVDWKHFTNATEAIKALKEKGYKVYAIEQAENSLMLQKLEFKADEKIAVIFGNEVTGVEQETILQCDGCIEIPQLGMKHSLNIATAAGVVLWEIVRGRIQTGN